MTIHFHHHFTLLQKAVKDLDQGVELISSREEKIHKAGGEMNDYDRHVHLNLDYAVVVRDAAEAFMEALAAVQGKADNLDPIVHALATELAELRKQHYALHEQLRMGVVRGLPQNTHYFPEARKDDDRVMGKGFYFHDETEELHGPFETIDACTEAQVEYGKTL